METKPWYQTYFGEDYLEAFSPGFHPERTSQEVDFIDRTLALPTGSRILDLCCGHGRHLIELAALGYAMTGLDLDPLFLDIARQEADRRELTVRLEHRDMRDIPFTSEFDGIVNYFTAFGCFEEEEENQTVLEGVASALKPGGRFLIDVMSRDHLVRIHQSRDWQETENGVKILYNRQFDPLRGRNNVQRTMIYPDGTVKEATHSIRVYTGDELIRMLTMAGLKIEGVYGDSDGRPFTIESPRLVILSRK